MKFIITSVIYLSITFNIYSSTPSNDSTATRKTIFFNEDLLLVLEQQQRESLIANEKLIKKVSPIHQDEVQALHKKTVNTWNYMEQLKSYLVTITGGIDTDGYTPIAKYDCEKVEEMVCDTTGKNLFKLAEETINKYLKQYPSEFHEIDSFEFEFESKTAAYKPIENSEITRVDVRCMNIMEAQYLLTIMQLKVVGKERSFILEKLY